MASSSRAAEGTHKVANEIPEDLVLSWARDETTLVSTFGTFLENDRQLLQELIQCVHEGKDANATKEKLSLLLGTGKDRKSAVTRARVLTRLISIALGLRPEDITTDPETGKESLLPSVRSQTTRLVSGLQDNNSVLGYLFKDALEADDEVMTVILCDPLFFEMYQVPYFHGCDLDVVRKISNLWLSQEIRRGFYYSTILQPLFNQVEVKQLKGRRKPPKILLENLHQATVMLCECLQRRTVKAGARLLEVMFSFREDIMFNVLELVKGLVVPLVGFKNGKFRKCFFGDFEIPAREARWHSQGSDQVHWRDGKSITVGPSCAQTDSNLLCWAARRGYFNLIWCISLGYTEARPQEPTKNPYQDATEELAVSVLWKVAFWCAARHGQDSVLMELARPSWAKNIDINDYSGIARCLPPLHLVSLLGDRSLLYVLRMGEMPIGSGAHRSDYLGKTPLDYAMQFHLTTKNSKEEMPFKVITTDIKNRPHFQVSNNGFKKWTGMIDPPIYSGGMLMPTQRRESCIKDLLTMPGVADRLKELNDMYITQSNFVLVGAALIASVAFAGWLQPPLGYADYFQFTSPSPPAPADTYEQYVALEGHLSVQLFVAFNALSFFLGIGTMLIGAEATLFFHDNEERTVALMKVRKSIKWMLGFFIASMVFIMAAFICAGLAILPPIQRLKWSMIVSLSLGACICFIPLVWMLLPFAKIQKTKLEGWMVKLTMLFEKKREVYYSMEHANDSFNNLDGSLMNEEDMNTLHGEMKAKLQDEKKRRKKKKESGSGGEGVEKKEEKKEEKIEEEIVEEIVEEIEEKKAEKKAEKEEEEEEEEEKEEEEKKRERFYYYGYSSYEDHSYEDHSLQVGPLKHGRSLISMY